MSREEAVAQYQAYYKVAHPREKALIETLRRDAQTLKHGIERFVQEQVDVVERDPRSVIAQGLDGIKARYDKFEAVGRAIGLYPEEHQSQPQREVRGPQEEVIARGYKGDLSKDVRKYLAVRSRQNRFYFMQVAEDFGMKNRPAPIYRIMQGVEYLKEKEIKGRKAFDRKR